MDSTLRGRVAVVTGGGRGIGAATARALARAGAGVLVTARTSADVDALAAEIGGTGVVAHGVACDVTEPASVRRMAEVARERFGRVDILVNNAGRAHSSPTLKVSLDEWNALFAVNATSALLCIQAFLPGMLDRGWGRIVNVASIAGLAGGRYIAAYSAAKHALVGLTRCVAADVAERGVTVNAVCPGYVDTDMTRESIDRIVEKTRLSREAATQAILDQSPQRRLIAPEEVAHAILGLCADDARGITGQTIVIDGGALLR